MKVLMIYRFTQGKLVKGMAFMHQMNLTSDSPFSLLLKWLTENQCSLLKQTKFSISNSWPIGKVNHESMPASGQFLVDQGWSQEVCRAFLALWVSLWSLF